MYVVGVGGPQFVPLAIRADWIDVKLEDWLSKQLCVCVRDQTDRDTQCLCLYGVIAVDRQTDAEL